MAQPWEFQPGIDSGPSFEAFSFYLKIPAVGAMAAVAAACHVSPATVSNWARWGLWSDRKRAYIESLNAHMYAAAVDEMKKTGQERATDLIENIIGPVKSALAKEATKLQVDAVEREHRILKPNEFARLFTEINRAERLLHGEATEIQADELDLKKLTTEELEQLDKLHQKAKRGP